MSRFSAVESCYLRRLWWRCSIGSRWGRHSDNCRRCYDIDRRHTDVGHAYTRLYLHQQRLHAHGARWNGSHYPITAL